ncbi:hypothetical protein [Duncaniella muris]|uniref:hypothetical protein n=1 Tax=Duncaniella muris TaxID=2094150 RepID=UPI003F68149A
MRDLTFTRKSTPSPIEFRNCITLENLQAELQSTENLFGLAWIDPKLYLLSAILIILRCFY